MKKEISFNILNQEIGNVDITIVVLLIFFGDDLYPPKCGNGWMQEIVVMICFVLLEMMTYYLIPFCSDVLI